jgi:hypothetical protein
MFKNVKSKYLILGALLIVGIGGFFLGRYFSHPISSVAVSSTLDPAIPNIPTPKEWYLWGREHLPHYPNATDTTVNNVTFGNQPINNTGNVTSTSITVTANDITDTNGNPVSTDSDWAWLRGILDSGESQTSTQVWDIVDNKLVLGEVSLNPSGRYMLTYYLIYGGDEYVFQLIPSPFLPSSAQYNQINIINSPDAQTLRGIVESVAGQI